MPDVQPTSLVYSFIFCHTSCGILVPQPGVEPVHPAVKALSLNHWTTREVPEEQFLRAS